MTQFVVFSRRVGSPFQSCREAVFATLVEAQAFALRRNCKPFTPFFWWVDERSRAPLANDPHVTNDWR